MNRDWPQLLNEVDAAGYRVVLAVEARPQLLQPLFENMPSAPALLELVRLTDERATFDWLGSELHAGHPDERALATAVAAYLHAKNVASDPGHSLIGMSAVVPSEQVPVSHDGPAILVATQTATATRLYRWRNFAATTELGTRRAVLVEFLKVVLLEASGETTGAITANFCQIDVESFSEEPSAVLVDLWNGTLPVVWSLPGGNLSDSTQNPPTLILSGSFNPLHGGHVELLRAAERRLGGPACFEMPIRNADKPPLDYLTIARRRRQFADERLLLTGAPTFAEKTLLLPGCTFVVGIDTAMRVLDARYYGNDVARMHQALAAIRTAGCRFLVAGRKLDERFRDLAEVALPRGFDDLFLALPESEFRCDVSSSELRRASEKHR